MGPTIPTGVHDSTGRPYELRFVCINTDGDTEWWERALALGSFCDQLDKLATHPKMVSPCPSHEIRILLMHHAHYYRRLPWLQIRPASRRRLRAFLAEHAIRVALSGHIHSTHFEFIGPARGFLARIFSRSVGSETLEANCGMTARDAGWLSRNVRKMCIGFVNQLVVHTVVESHGRVYWLSEDYHFQEDHGFVKTAATTPPLQTAIYRYSACVRLV
ncbi:MAG: metallophosphoesterase [Bacteroidetes bacterium]|nr:metallophosphoesterase [Bacteroidota bacterium]